MTPGQYKTKHARRCMLDAEPAQNSSGQSCGHDQRGAGAIAAAADLMIAIDAQV